VAIVALRDIALEEEIEIDYGWGRATSETVCACGVPLCRGIIGLKAERAHSLKALSLGEWRLPTSADLVGGGPAGLVGKWVRVFWVGDKGLPESEMNFDDDELGGGAGLHEHSSSSSSSSSSLSMPPEEPFLGPVRVRRIRRVDKSAAGTWYTGRIVGYNKAKRLHQVQYTVDGDVEEENLLEAVHAGSSAAGGTGKEASFWLVLNPARTRSELVALMQRTAADPGKLVAYTQKIDPSVPALPSCPAFDMSLSELSSVRLAFPDDRQEGTLDSEGIEKGVLAVPPAQSPTSSAAAAAAAAASSSSSSSSSAGLVVDTTLDHAEGTTSTAADGREVSALVIPRGKPRSSPLGSPEASSGAFPGAESGSSFASRSFSSSTAAPTPTAGFATSVAASIAASVFTPSAGAASAGAAAGASASSTPGGPAAISQNALQQEREVEAARQREREAGALVARQQQQLATALAEEKQREAASRAYQEALAAAFRAKMAAAQSAPGSSARHGSGSGAGAGAAASSSSSSSSSSSGAGAAGDKRGRPTDDEKRRERKERKRHEKKKEHERRKRAKEAVRAAKRGKRDAVKFAPPTTDLVPSSLPLAGAGAPCYPFLALPAAAWATTAGSRDALVSAAVGMAARISAAVGESDMDVDGGARAGAGAGAMPGAGASAAAANARAAVGRALLLSLSAPGPAVLDQGVAAAAIAVLACNPPASPASSSASAALSPDLLDAAVAAAAAETGAFLAAETIAAAVEAVLAGLPAASPALLASSFAFAAGVGPLDTDPFPTPLTLVAAATAVVAHAVLEAPAFRGNAGVAAEAAVHANALRARVTAASLAGVARLPSAVGAGAGAGVGGAPASLPDSIRSTAEALTCWVCARAPELWVRFAPRAVAAAIVYSVVGAVLPPVAAHAAVQDGGVMAYESAVDMTRTRTEYSKSSHAYVQGGRWAGALRSLGLVRAHVGEVREALGALGTGLADAGLVAASFSAAALHLVGGGAGTPTAAAAAAAASSASTTSPLASRQTPPLSAVSGLRVQRRVGQVRLASVASAGMTDDTASAAGPTLALRPLSERELTLTLRLHAGKWDEMAMQSHEGRKSARDASSASASSSAHALPVPPRGVCETAAEVLLAEDTFFGPDHVRALLNPSATSSAAAAAAKVPRHPHFLAPLHVLLDDASSSSSSSLLGAFEYTPHTIGSLARAGVLAALSVPTRHRMAYQLLRALSRAEDRRVILNGAVRPSAAATDAEGHVRLDLTSGATMVQERAVGRTMHLLCAPQPGVPEHKQRRPDERAAAELRAAFAAPALRSPTDWTTGSPTGHALLQLPRASAAAAAAAGSRALPDPMDLACLSPELLLGCPAALPASDLWALGATWAAIYTGGTGPFPDMAGVAAAHAEHAPEGSDPNEVALQGRVLAAVAAIEAVMGPLAVAWPLSSALPAAAWVDAMLATLRAVKPGLAPVAPVTTAAGAADALRSRFLFQHGLRPDVADLIVRAMAVDPVRRGGVGGGVREIVAAPVWKADVADVGPAAAAAIAQARERLLPRLDLGGAEGGSSGLVSGVGAEADATLLAALQHDTRWRSKELRVARAGLVEEGGEGEEGEEEDDSDSSSGEE
jgi:hypothetical protein